MSDRNVNERVAKAWSEKVGRDISFELLEVEAHDGRKQTQLINPETGAIVVAVDAVGDRAVETLVHRAGEPFIHDAFTQLEIDGPNQANQVNKSDTDVPTPAGAPGAAVEAEKSEDAGSLAEDQGEGSDEEASEDEADETEDEGASEESTEDEGTDEQEDAGEGESSEGEESSETESESEQDESSEEEDKE